MTAQTANIIWIDGKKRWLLADAMDGFFERFGRPRFQMRTTANWCGYTTEWELRGDRLYLTGLEGDIRAGSVDAAGNRQRREITLADLLEEQSEPLFADWVSETMRVAWGEIVHYVHGGWASQHENEELLIFQGGLLTGRRRIRPRPSLRTLIKKVFNLGPVIR